MKELLGIILTLNIITLGLVIKMMIPKKSPYKVTIKDVSTNNIQRVKRKDVL